MTTKDTSGIQKWSTSVVVPGQRLDYWIGAVCEGFLEMDITSPLASHFEASLERGQLGSIGCWERRRTFIEPSRQSREANRTIITCCARRIRNGRLCIMTTSPASSP